MRKRIIIEYTLGPLAEQHTKTDGSNGVISALTMIGAAFKPLTMAAATQALANGMRFPTEFTVPEKFLDARALKDLTCSIIDATPSTGIEEPTVYLRPVDLLRLGDGRDQPYARGHVEDYIARLMQANPHLRFITTQAQPKPNL